MCHPTKMWRGSGAGALARRGQSVSSRVTQRSRCGKGAVSFGPTQLTFYLVQTYAYANDNLFVAPPLTWVVLDEADAITMVSGWSRAVREPPSQPSQMPWTLGDSCRRGEEGRPAENGDLLEEVFCFLPLILAIDVVPHTNDLQLNLFPRGMYTRDMNNADAIKQNHW